MTRLHESVIKAESVLNENKYYYYIDMDERGEFRCDVRDENDKIVWEYEWTEDDDIFADGFMKNKEDVDGLEKHLKDVKILKQGDSIEKSN